MAGASAESAILLPCLIAMPTGLLRVPGSDIRHFIRRRTPDGHWEFTRGASPSMRVNFLIQRDGSLCEVRPLRTRRGWAAAFAKVFDIVVLECEVTPARHLSNAELLIRLQDVPAKAPFALAGKLRRFVKGLPERESFDERRFREFWEEAGYPLPADAWAENLS